MDNNLPVYSFIGYNLISVLYSRKSNTAIEYFAIKTKNTSFDERTGLYEIYLEVNIKYTEENISKFVFKSEFKINDLNWKNQFNDEILVSLFVSVIFPFIREKIYSVTDDSRGGFILPIIDLRNFSLSKGAKFTPSFLTKEEKSN